MNNREIGVIVTLILAIITGAVFVGKLDGKLTALEQLSIKKELKEATETIEKNRNEAVDSLSKKRDEFLEKGERIISSIQKSELEAINSLKTVKELSVETVKKNESNALNSINNAQNFLSSRLSVVETLRNRRTNPSSEIYVL